MPIAFFRTTTSPVNQRVDHAAGIIYGCQVVKAGSTARFAGKDGPEEIDVTPELIKSLASLATGRSLNAHWSHDWINSEKDPIHDKIGGWKNIRVEENTGNLIGDLHVMPGQYREAVLWLADNTPDGAMMSIVFGYERINDRHAMPKSFSGIDIVEVGAATDAFFSQSIQPKNKPMTKEELIALFADPQVKEAARAAFAKDEGDEKTEKEAADKAAKDKADKEAENAALAAEKAAGVTDADKKDEDAALPAALRAVSRISRATDRKIAAMAGDAAVRAEAALTAKIGNGKPLSDLKDADKNETFEQAKIAALAAGCKNEAEAIRFVAAKKPELYNAHMTGGKA